MAEKFEYYYSHNQSHNGIKEALLDGNTTNEKNHKMRDIVNTKKALSSIKALIQQNYTMFGSIPLTMD